MLSQNTLDVYQIENEKEIIHKQSIKCRQNVMKCKFSENEPDLLWLVLSDGSVEVY